MQPPSATQQPQEPQPAPAAPAGDGPAKLVYVLYLVSLALGVTSIVGVVVAYQYAGEAPEALKTHYRFQIRTFWIGLLYSLAGFLLTFVLVGFAVFAFVAVWLIVRCVKGLRWLDRREAVPEPATWLW